MVPAPNQTDSWIDSASIDYQRRVTNINPNAEDVQAVRVAAQNYSAEYGRNGAALVNIITKQGSNDWHGTLGFYHTDNVIRPATSSRPRYRYPPEPGAGVLAAPIRKNHTFFFASMDFLKLGVAFGSAATILTPNFVNFMETNFPNNVSTSVSDSPGLCHPGGWIYHRRHPGGVNCSGSTPIQTEVGMIPCNFQVTGVGSYAKPSPQWFPIRGSSGSLV